MTAAIATTTTFLLVAVVATTTTHQHEQQQKLKQHDQQSSSSSSPSSPISMGVSAFTYPTTSSVPSFDILQRRRQRREAADTTIGGQATILSTSSSTLSTGGGGELSWSALSSLFPSSWSSWMNRINNSNDDIDAATTLTATEAMILQMNINMTMIEIGNVLRKRFQVGDEYIWMYQDQEGTPTSWEKYTITGINNNKNSDSNDEHHDDHEVIVTIEMSTKFEEDDLYSTHHRIHANLTDRLINSNNSWKIGFEYYNHNNNNNEEEDGSNWIRFGKGENIQAFEEKFDIFTMIQGGTTGTSLPSAATSTTAVHVVDNGDTVNSNNEENQLLSSISTSSSSSSSNTSSTAALPITTECEARNNDINNNHNFDTTHRRRRCSNIDVLLTGYDDVKDKDKDKEVDNNGVEEEEESSLVVVVPTNTLMRTNQYAYTGAWYSPSDGSDDGDDDESLVASDGVLSGVALYKEFPNSNHTFSLIEMTRKTETKTQKKEATGMEWQ